MGVDPVINLVGDQAFQQYVLASRLPILVDFTASWCMPCKQIGAMLEQMAHELLGRAEIVAVDVDASPRTAAAYGIRSLPTLIVLRGGSEVARHVGANVSPMRIRQILGMG